MRRGAFAAMMIATAVGHVIDMSETLKSFPVQLRSVHEYARQVLGKA
jgi:hypothetical protein